MKSKLVCEVVASLIGYSILASMFLICWHSLSSSENHAFSAGYMIGVVSGVCLFFVASKVKEDDIGENGYTSDDPSFDPAIPTGGSGASHCR